MKKKKKRIKYISIKQLSFYNFCYLERTEKWEFLHSFYEKREFLYSFYN